MSQIKDCCYACGRERYGKSYLKNDITMYEGICPFCKKKSLLIPSDDWVGRED
jgi:hypothetical protein